MRVFVTGASGFIGTAVVQELLSAGHQVVGLARSPESAAKLVAAGAGVHEGSIDDLDSLKRGAAASDGVIHLAYDHSFTDFAAAGETDKRAILAMSEALEGTGKSLIMTSGTLMQAIGATVPNPSAGTEEDAYTPQAPHLPRAGSEIATLALAEKNVRGMVVRLPPTVHGDGDHGFVPILIKKARENGESVYLGDGLNHWPAVHRLDAAKLYRLALEKGVAGQKYHAVAEEGVEIRKVAEVIGKQLGVSVVSKPIDAGPEALGFLGGLLWRDNVTSSALTRERLGWQPTQVGLIEDLEKGTYF